MEEGTFNRRVNSTHIGTNCQTHLLAVCSSFLLGFGTRPAFSLQVVLDRLPGREPVAPDLDAIDLTFTEKATNKAGSQTTEAGGL